MRCILTISAPQVRLQTWLLWKREVQDNLLLHICAAKDASFSYRYQILVVQKLRKRPKNVCFLYILKVPRLIGLCWWRRRRSFNCTMSLFVKSLRLGFICRMVQVGVSKRWLWRHPQYLLLLMLVRVGGSVKFEDQEWHKEGATTKRGEHFFKRLL